MGIKRIALGMVISLIVIATLFAIMDKPALRAQDPDSEAEIIKRLDTILKNQSDMIARLEDIRSELNIVKIRVSQAQ